MRRRFPAVLPSGGGHCQPSRADSGRAFHALDYPVGEGDGSIRKQGLEEALGELPDIPWKWIEQTESQLRADGATESQLLDRRRELAGSHGDDSELEGLGGGGRNSTIPTM